MSFLEKLKASLKDKWLEYYQINRLWIKALLNKPETWVKVADGGNRPPAYFILGVISLLEPNLKEMLLPFCQLNPDADKLVTILGLHFDPDIELEKRTTELSATQEAEIVSLLSDTDSNYLNKIREESLK